MAFRVFHSPQEWRARLGNGRKPVALTVGNFDGLHLGHVQLLRAVVEAARRMNIPAAAITFDPHPLRILRPAEAPLLITRLAARLEGLQQLGLDAALVMKFDSVLSKMSADDFVRTILVETMRARLICVGENFRFGNRHAGDVTLLRSIGAQAGFDVQIVPPVKVRGIVVSSTAIRRAVAEGRVTHAARLLGRPFALAGQIESGEGNGRKLLVPTLNLATDSELLPRTGVYATETIVGGRKYPSATNVGFRPTFNGTCLTIESHLFGFSADVKKGPLEVHFWRRLRDERKFASVDELREQIRKDLCRAETFFTRLARAETNGLARALQTPREPGPVSR